MPGFKVPDTSNRRPFSFHADAALQWISRSIAATGGQGSAHSYSPVWGWAKAYPETTGYLIPTLLWYAEKTRDSDLRQTALQCGQWLCSIQLPGGAFPGGMAGNSRPSAFNTGMILFGLANLDKEILAEEQKSLIRNALEKAVDWLLGLVDPDGAWRQAAYVEGFVPSYYTRAVWGLLEAGTALQHPETEAAMRLALHFYARRFQPDGTVRDWGFRPGVWAFSHTVAYTLEGFLECSVQLPEQDVLEQTIRSGTALLCEYRRAGRTAGRYGAGWAGDYSFRCLPGSAQLSALFYRFWEVTGVEKFRQAAHDILMEVTGFQRLGKNVNTFGAIAGSAPGWGPYLRLRYPNWGAKFLLDAIGPFLQE